MNKLKTTLFLAFILLTGTIASVFPSSFIGGIDAQEALPDYRLDNYNSKFSSFEQDNIKCNNFNLNANGLDFNEIPESLRDLVASHIEAEDSGTGVSGYGRDEKRFGSYDNKKDFAFICINNNDNELIISPSPTPTPPIRHHLHLHHVK